MHMYPNWPKSDADLVPLPLVDGPKLPAFDFNGPQKIEFLELLGQGLHSFVFKVAISKKHYALKLASVSLHLSRCRFRLLTVAVSQFRFGREWQYPEGAPKEDHDEAHIVFAQYSEPFYAECRAYGRLLEAGQVDLSVRCHGYILLDEAHEGALQAKFGSDVLDGLGGCFQNRNGDRWLWSEDNVTKPPPIRGLLKDLAITYRGIPETDEPEPVVVENAPDAPEFRLNDAQKFLANIVSLHQLGIVGLDIAPRQIFVGGKVGDFSVAKTAPHHNLNAQTTPLLDDQVRALVDYDAFQFTMNDYWVFKRVVVARNRLQERPRLHWKLSSFRLLPSWTVQTRYGLRRTPARTRFYTPANPREYSRVMQQRPGKLPAKLKKWYFPASGWMAGNLRTDHGEIDYSIYCILGWSFRDGKPFPWLPKHTARNIEKWEEEDRRKPELERNRLRGR